MFIKHIWYAKHVLLTKNIAMNKAAKNVYHLGDNKITLICGRRETLNMYEIVYLKISSVEENKESDRLLCLLLSNKSYFHVIFPW